MKKAEANECKDKSWLVDVVYGEKSYGLDRMWEREGIEEGENNWGNIDDWASACTKRGSPYVDILWKMMME